MVEGYGLTSCLATSQHGLFQRPQFEYRHDAASRVGNGNRGVWDKSREKEVWLGCVVAVYSMCSLVLNPPSSLSLVGRLRQRQAMSGKSRQEFGCSSIHGASTSALGSLLNGQRKITSRIWLKQHQRCHQHSRYLLPQNGTMPSSMQKK